MTIIHRIALFHPGLMGASVGASAVTAGCEVGWLGTGRSDATSARAAAARLVRFASADALLENAHIVLSICPPAAALAIAKQVAAKGFNGIYVDANAIAPQTAEQIAEVVCAEGAEYVDGSLIGPPLSNARITRLYLAGERAARVADCFCGSLLEVIDLGVSRNAASALKMCYAAWSKGSAALLLAVAAAAKSAGVSAALEAEWARSQPAVVSQIERESSANAAQAWRFVGEMTEIAKTFSAVGLPPEFHLAAAEIYRRLAPLRMATGPLSRDDVIAQIIGEHDSSP